MIELEIVGTISHETVKKTFKKNWSTRKKIEYWVIPPESNGEFAACMEDVLEIYSKPYDPRIPVVCMVEQPIQILNLNR